jgi:response regulator RpfG family c-di-GMP phosphodiesterase
MLTGNADQATAADAVNEGRIFRFLSKPCPQETLLKTLQAGVEQHRLIVAEKQLLEETLNGGIKVLGDVLSLVNPRAFGRATRLRRYARHIADKLALPSAWKYEVAATLSQVGCVTLAPETIDKLDAGAELDAQEARAVAAHPELAGRLIADIPRLEDVAHMIARQNEPFAWDRAGPPRERDEVALGGHVLAVAVAFDKLLVRGLLPQKAIRWLRSRPTEFDPAIVDALEDLPLEDGDVIRRACEVSQLDPGMILDQDVRSRLGGLVMRKGQEITLTALEVLRRWSRGAGLQEPINVLMPRPESHRRLPQACP